MPGCLLTDSNSFGGALQSFIDRTLSEYVSYAPTTAPEVSQQFYKYQSMYTSQLQKYNTEVPKRLDLINSISSDLADKYGKISDRKQAIMKSIEYVDNLVKTDLIQDDSSLASDISCSTNKPWQGLQCDPNHCTAVMPLLFTSGIECKDSEQPLLQVNGYAQPISAVVMEHNGTCKLQVYDNGGSLLEYTGDCENAVMSADKKKVNLFQCQVYTNHTCGTDKMCHLEGNGSFKLQTKCKEVGADDPRCHFPVAILDESCSMSCTSYNSRGYPLPPSFNRPSLDSTASQYVPEEDDQTPAFPTSTPGQGQGLCRP